MKIPSPPVSDADAELGAFYRTLRDQHMVFLNKDGKLGPKARLREAEDRASQDITRILRGTERNG